jgi:16S rRNA (cytidine1402-2'-O)-methyltransferase
MYEAFIREQVDELGTFQGASKGELTIVISENNIKDKKFNEEKIVNKIKKYLKNYSLKDTVNLILETEKINKKKIYDLCLKVKDNE